MQGIHKVKKKNLDCIPNTMEHYISFSMGKLQFIDSYRYMASSLESLVHNLDDMSSPLLQDQFRNVCTLEALLEEVLPLLTQKGHYPYAYMDSFTKFEETSLPPQDAFFNDLTQEPLTQEAYQHAPQVWEKMGCQDMGDDHDVYLTTDTLLLANVFENFRNICLATYDLHSALYYTAPGLAWHAALKLTNIKLDTLTDINRYLFIEQELRGGISMTTYRYAQAKHSYLDKNNPMLPFSYII